MKTSSMKQPKKQKTDWWIWTVPILLLFTLLFYFIVQSRLGIVSVILFYLSPLVIGGLAVIFLIIGFIISIIRRPFFTKWRIAGFAGLTLLCFSGILYDVYPSSYDDKPSKVQFRLPLDTSIAVAWGGERKENNYHVIAPDQRWAYDLLVMNGGKSYEGDSTKLENYFCYGLPVLAPAAGKVIAASDSKPDTRIGSEGDIFQPVGNHIIMEVAPKEFLFLCHLQPHSVLVKKGDLVQQGQVLAKVGNSGHTSEPHIHIHLQSTAMPALGEGIPLYFHQYLLNGKLINKGIPTGGFDNRGRFIGQVVKNKN
jgi:hypothetical protein